MKVEFSRKTLKKYSNFKCHENPSRGSSAVHGDGRTDGQTGMTKLVVVFRNCVKKPKIVASIMLYFYMQEMSLI
jgi:hypothetical protein